MRILVAGTGFIGSKIVEELGDEHHVKTLDRSGADFQYDITREFNVDEEFDVVFHTIGLAPGMKSQEIYEKVHVEGTRNLLNAVESDKIVYLSALGVGGVDHSFFQTKEEAEDTIKNSGRNYTIIRPSTVYGEGNKLLKMIRKAASLRVFPNLETETQPIHIEDLIEILRMSLEDFDGEKLELGGPEKMKVGELARKLYREKGYRCILLPAPRCLLEISFKIIPISGPFNQENIQLLRQQNTVEGNDAEEILGKLKRV